VLEWPDSLPAKIQDKCVVKIERLRELGHELRRPEADLLQNGICELQFGRGGILGGMTMAKRKHPTTSDAVQILYRLYYEGRPEQVRGLEDARVNDSVERKLTGYASERD